MLALSSQVDYSTGVHVCSNVGLLRMRPLGMGLGGSPPPLLRSQKSFCSLQCHLLTCTCFVRLDWARSKLWHVTCLNTRILEYMTPCSKPLSTRVGWWWSNWFHLCSGNKWLSSKFAWAFTTKVKILENAKTIPELSCNAPFTRSHKVDQTRNNPYCFFPVLVIVSCANWTR